jgi:hypothetical protein
MKIIKKIFLLIFLIAGISLMRCRTGKKYENTALEHGYLEISLYTAQYQAWVNVIDTISCADCENYTIRADAHKSIRMLMGYGNDSIGVIRLDHFSFAQDFIKFSDDHGLYRVAKNIASGEFSFDFGRRFDEQYVALIYFRQGAENGLSKYKNYPVVTDLKKGALGNKGLYVFNENWIILVDDKQ